MRKINEIIVHCTATKEGHDYTVNDIDRWHKKRGFKCIGYHYVVYRDGSIHEGRPLSEIGAHCLKHNTNSIGVVYIGGCDEQGRPKDTRTDEQKAALLKLLESLLKVYSLDINDVHCHNEFANKQCPSFKIETLREEYNNYIDG